MADEFDEDSQNFPGFSSKVGRNGEEDTNASARMVRRKRPRLSGIRVKPAISSSRYPEYEAPPFSELAFGYLAYVYIDMPGATPMQLLEKKISIRAIRFLSPVINSAVTANGSDDDVGYIALPPGNREAYQAIFAWLENSIDQGSITTFSVQPSHTYLIPYQNVLDIAENLQIRPLLEQTRQRLDFELEYTTAEKHFIHFIDVCQLYGSHRYCKEHPLRKAVAKSLARAWIDPALSSGKQKALLSLIVGFEELWVEMVEILNDLVVWDMVFPNWREQLGQVSDTNRREHLCSGTLLNRVYRP